MEIRIYVEDEGYSAYVDIYINLHFINHSMALIMMDIDAAIQFISEFGALYNYSERLQDTVANGSLIPARKEELAINTTESVAKKFGLTLSEK